MEESRFAAVLEAMPDGIVVADLAGRIVYVNDRAIQLAGYEESELLGEPVERLVPSRLRPGHEDHRARYAAEEYPTRPMGTELDIRLQRKDGSELAVDIALSKLDTPDGPLIVAAVRDATERKRAEAMIRENEKRWRTLLETVPLAVVGLDTSGRVTYANPYLCELTGYARSEVIGADWFERFLPPEERGEVPEGFGEAVVGGAERHVSRIVTRSGAHRTIAWFNTRLSDESRELSGTLSIGEDITERERTRLRFDVVGALSRTVLEGGGASEIYDELASGARRLTGGDLSLVLARERSEGDVLSVEAAEGIGAGTLLGTIVSVAGPVWARAVRTGRALRTSDLSGIAAPDDPLAEAIGSGPTLVVAPGRDRVSLLVVVAGSPGSRGFTADHEADLEHYATQAAVAVEYARARQELADLAVVRDRERIARELHDGVIQALFGVGLRLRALAKRQDDPDPWIDEAIEELNRAQRDIRNYIHELRPEILGGARLDDAVRRLAKEFERRTGITTVVRVDRDSAEEMARHATQVMQIAHEALSNVGRHSGASSCFIDIRTTGGTGVLELEDDGRGFDVSEAPRGMGLGNLQERAAQIGGKIEVRSGEGAGTTIRLTVPL